jgi:hypothetical protein
MIRDADRQKKRNNRPHGVLLCLMISPSMPLPERLRIVGFDSSLPITIAAAELYPTWKVWIVLIWALCLKRYRHNATRKMTAPRTLMRGEGRRYTGTFFTSSLSVQEV